MVCVMQPAVCSSQMQHSCLTWLCCAIALLGPTRNQQCSQRSGQRQELLRGPLLYGCSHVALTLAFWRENPAAVLGIAALCAGAS
jgi:hypothetical protein